MTPFFFVMADAILLTESSRRSEELNAELLAIDTLLFTESFRRSEELNDESLDISSFAGPLGLEADFFRPF
jgi:hypothetical protein